MCPDVVIPQPGPGEMVNKTWTENGCCETWIKICVPTLCPAGDDLECEWPLSMTRLDDQECCPRMGCGEIPQTIILGRPGLTVSRASYPKQKKETN